MRYRLYMQMNILLRCITCSDPIYHKDMESHVKMALSLYDEALKKKKNGLTVELWILFICGGNWL